MNGLLIVRQGDEGHKPGEKLRLGRDVITIGRSTENDIILEDAMASRLHARITWQNDAYFIEDAGSRNGTRVEGVLLDGPRRLGFGDVVLLPGLELVFQTWDGTETVADQRIVAPSPASGLQVDESSGIVFLQGRELLVTAKEFAALSLLSRSVGRIIRRDELAAHVWPELDGIIEDSSLDQLISRLRRKLEDDPRAPRYLLTVRGRGYRLNLQ